SAILSAGRGRSAPGGPGQGAAAAGLEAGGQLRTTGQDDGGRRPGRPGQRRGGRNQDQSRMIQPGWLTACRIKDVKDADTWMATVCGKARKRNALPPQRLLKPPARQ